jgi:hypothetical protein
MTSAIELIEDPSLAIDDIVATSAASARHYYTNDELRVFQIGEADLHDLFIKIYNAGTKVGDEIVLATEGLGTRIYKDDIRSIITDATIEDAIDQTPTFTITIHDPDWELLNSGCLTHSIDINPGNAPGRWYRLVTVAPNDDDVTLTFMTRNAVYLSYHTRPYKVSRNKMTRAQFIKTLLRHVKKKGVKIKMYCPELNKKQPIAKTRPASKRSVKSRRGQGFDAGVKLSFTGNDGTQFSMNSHDLKIADDVLTSGDQKGASPRAMVGAIMVVSIETNFGRGKNPKYVGVFQQDPRYWPATGDAYKDANGIPGKHGFFDVFIPLVRSNPTADLGDLCQRVQGAGDPLYAMKCDRARANAEKIVEAWTGLPSGAADNQDYAASYEFMVGPPDGNRGENYLEAMYRLAEQVNWRAYWVNDVLHFISEADLFKARAVARLRYHKTGGEGRTKWGGVSAIAEHVSATWNRGKKVQEMTVSVRMDNWVAPVGTVVVFDEGGPLEGRWLIANIRKSVFDTLGDITLRKPLAEKKEPAHDMRTRATGGGDTSPVNPGDVSGTPKDIIDSIVIPIALSISDQFQAGGGTGRLTAENVAKANAQHGPTKGGNRSDHQGPPWYAWAADISDNWGSSHGSPKMDQLAKELAHYFGLPRAWGGNQCWSVIHGRYRYQICYRMNTAQAGNHMNHVHFGVLDTKASPTTPPGSVPKQTHGGPAGP